MTVPSAEERVAPLRGALDEALEKLPQLRFLAPAGVLTVPVDSGPLTVLRLEADGEFLHLQSIGLVTADGSDASLGARVTTSSRYDGHEEIDVAHLFDWDHPVGTAFHTGKDNPSWLEVKFAKPVRLTEIRLRNVANATGWRARQLRMVGRTRWRRQHVLFDFDVVHRAMGAMVRARLKRELDPADTEVKKLVPVLVNTLRAAYPVARKALTAAKLETELSKAFRDVVNAELLPSRELLWTIHGPCRAFRYWTQAQKVAYIEFTNEVVDALREVTPHVSYGFGSVLSVVRDKELIPHDDDLDIIIAFEPHEAATLADGLALVTTSLEERGFSVRGTFPAHRQVGRGGRGKHLDVFVGLFEGDEGDTISWYPGARGALSRSMMYPTTTAPLLGIDCVIPARAEEYLAAVYGEGWSSPDPNFAHQKDRKSYADISGAPAKARTTP